MMTLVRGSAQSAERDPIDLGEYLPETRTVIVNGQPHEAWITRNRRYPRRLRAQLDRARSRYLAVAASLLAPPLSEDELAQLTPAERAEHDAAMQRAIDGYDEAYQAYLTDSLMALIPTLDEQTAELIDDDKAEQLLRDLGYFQAQPVPEAPDTRAEAEAGAQDDPLTGATASPDSAVSTASASNSS